jgi:hypothetical protein
MHRCVLHKESRNVNPKVITDTGANYSVLVNDPQVVSCPRQCAHLFRREPIKGTGVKGFLVACENPCNRVYHEDSLGCVCASHALGTNDNRVNRWTLISDSELKRTDRAEEVCRLFDKCNKSRKQLDSLYVPQLKKLCRVFRHPVTGLKGDLINRILMSMEHKDFESILQKLESNPLPT